MEKRFLNKDLCYILHELYPDFELEDYRPFTWVENSIIVWEKGIGREFLFTAWLTGEDAITKEGNVYSRHFGVYGHLSLTNQRLFDEYIKGEYSHEKCNRLYPSID